MFATLNRFISRLDAANDASFLQTGTGLDGTTSSSAKNGGSTDTNAFGFQVLRNSNKDIPLEPWFDFIVGINGRMIDSPDGSLFAAEVKNCTGASVELGVWSAKGQRMKAFYIPISTDSPSLGLSLQCTPLSVAEDVWHILDVATNSPADMAGLLPYGDYIIGSPEGIVRGESGLGDLVEHFLNQPLRLWVYNHEYNVTRMVTIEPSRSWGGSGALGCVLGFGALHRIPAPLDEPPQGPGETLFESNPRMSTDSYADTSKLQPQGSVPDATDDARQGQYLVPANMSFTPPPTASRPPTGPAKKGRNRPRAAHDAKATGASMDDYFAEEEAKSRRHEGGSSPKPPSNATAPPPPPKAGGPKVGSPAPSSSANE